MTIFDDLRLALRQICQAMGLSGTASTVVPLIVLGVALNVVALSAMESMRIERHREHAPMALRSVAQTEMKAMRTVVISTLKKIGNGSRRRWCVTQQRRMDQQTKGTGYPMVGFALGAPAVWQGCDVTVASSPARKAAMVFVQC
jgi:hypothetical protein